MKIWAAGAAMSLAGGAYFSGAVGGADIERIVARPPAQVYDGFHLVLNDYSTGLGDLAAFEAMTGEVPDRPPVDVKVAAVPNKHIDYQLLQQGRPILHIDVRFEPLEDGAKTRVLADLEIADLTNPNGGTIGPASGGLGFKMAVGMMMNQLIENIESGETGRISGQLSELKRRMASDPKIQEARREMERMKQEHAQRQAAAPMVRPTGTSARPMIDVSR